MEATSKMLLLLFMVAFEVFAAADRIPVADKRKYEMYLERFETSRTHYRPDGKENLQNATIFMKEKFESVGLDVDLQNFTTSDTTTGQTASGTNVIGILKGQFFGTANDDAIILGAHLDTQGLQQYGVNNDGSGLTALLTLAEDLTGKDKCVQNHSIIFVAFDRSETFNVQQGNAVCNKSCGSKAFVDGISKVLQGGTVKIAIIMDCISNFNLQKDSQREYRQPVKDYFNTFVETQGLIYENKGNYLAVIGREDEQDAMSNYVKMFEEVKTYSQYVPVEFMWNFKGKPTGLNLTNVETAFAKSDTLSFWDANIKSILLTDTCYQRDPLYTCKTSVWCDNSAKASRNDNLGFAYSTATAAKNLTKYYACTDVNECVLGNAECSKDATCKNTFGSYECKCKDGFTGNGFSCKDINECAEGSKCNKDAVCTNSPGSYHCKCKMGFSGNGFNTCVASGTGTAAAVFLHVVMPIVVGLLEFTM
ncbi:uncharacterized protein LOC113681912 [Pocillopora damicornis]|uniref:uncharacterized protein LOC113681912 n=1 Tax=Pocillopora damicornis TaxID=46731 RepID=UPI000F54D5A4|nr:uncharacterized protein LOC113681912 [Pocillopora damicornis]